MMMLDFQGGVVTLVMLIGFLLLLVGVYPSKLRENSLNLVRHGLFATIATVISLVSVFAAMIPVFWAIVDATSLASFSQFPVMWLHAVLGLLSIGLAIVTIALWIKVPLSELGCARTWRLMKPTLAIWVVTFALGIFIYIYGLM